MGDSRALHPEAFGAAASLRGLEPHRQALARNIAATAQVEEGTLNGYLEDVKAQFLDATTQHPVEPTQLIGGIPVAGLRDLAATKLKVVGDRGELRD